MDPQHLIPGDATLIENIVYYLKAKGIFDEFRHECLADVDTKSSCQNLSQRVDGYTSKFLANETWHPDLNKNELRNKLRRHIDESGMLAVGADHVVEQVINTKIHQFFLPKIIEVVHQYVKEQTELLNKKLEIITSENTVSSEKNANDVSENKTVISDPIADILSFSYTKAKSMPVTVKTENIQQKLDLTKAEKKKEEKNIPVIEKSFVEATNENMTTSVCNESKLQFDKEKDKIKKEEPEIQQEVPKKVVKDEVKPEKKKIEDPKTPASESAPVEESKTVVSISVKHTITKKDFNAHKQKLKSISQKSNSSNDMKKPKKESYDKSSEKVIKSKPSKSSKESSPTKSSNLLKSVFKEEKGDASKPKSSDSSYTKTSESSQKKSKPVCEKKDSSSSKLKGHKDKTDKIKISKSADKSEPNIHQDSSNSEKSSKNIQYSSSYDSSQGSDQERSSSSNSKQERPKHFSKHAKKEKPEHPDSNNKTLLDKKRSKDDDESPSKKYKNEKDSKLKLKDLATIEAAKISSRSNSFGSTSSVSSSSNASKDNMVLNSDEVSETIIKDKKKKKPIKEKESCQNTLKLPPPPPPPPPPSSSLSCELPSSTEMSSVEDTQSSSNSETSSNEEINIDSSSDSELESKDLIQNTLNESLLNSSSDNINAFYDIFLYSSSSSEFEGYGNSPGKKKMLEDVFKNMHDSDISISSVHTSDLSSFDDELSSDDDVAFLTGGLKKRLTLKEAQELIENKAISQDKKENFLSENKSDDGEVLSNKGCNQFVSFLSSDDESSPSEPKRSLRRERKLNPRYTSSEYTSIFNCRKETFITKQTSPTVKKCSFNSSVSSEPTHRKIDSLIENKISKKNLREIKKNITHQDGLEESEKNNLNTSSRDALDGLSDSSKISSSDEINCIMDRGKLFPENDRIQATSDGDKQKLHLKLKPHNNTKLKRNSLSVKRKLEVTEPTTVKRPCSRSSVDSSNSEFVPNENKPFNSEKQNFLEEKMLTDCNLKSPDLTGGIKKDVFCKQRTNNNGDILGQKDIFSKNSHGKAINNSEKKGNESDSSKELNSL